jgi:excisionase family DNA binding protein
MHDSKLLISVNEVAARLDLGRTVTSGLVSSGAIESVKIGARRLVPVSAVIDFVERLRASNSEVG